MASEETLKLIQSLSETNLPSKADEMTKRYYDPVVKPLIEEGGNLMSDWISSFATDLAGNPTAGNTVSPETVLANAMKTGGRKFGLFQSNQSARDFWGTNTQDLAKKLVDYYNTKLNTLQTRYQNEIQAEQFQKNLDFQREQFNANNALRNKETENSLSKLKEMFKLRYETPQTTKAGGISGAFAGAIGGGGGGGRSGGW